jgi:hypothetical protein
MYLHILKDQFYDICNSFTQKNSITICRKSRTKIKNGHFKNVQFHFGEIELF